MSQVNLSFPDSIYSSSNKPSVVTLKSDLSAIETGLNEIDTSAINRDGSVTSQSTQNMGGYKLLDVGTPTFGTDAVNKTYADAVVPTGVMWQWTTPTAPSGFVLCDGSAISRTTYADLFAVIGTNYGVGNGSTTFNIPDMKGKLPVGLDSGQTEFDALGETGGAKTHTITESELPSHTHTDSGHTHGVTDPGHTHTRTGDGDNGAGAGWAESTGSRTNSTSSSTTGISINSGTANISSTGGGTAHNNLPPYLVVNYIIKT